MPMAGGAALGRPGAEGVAFPGDGGGVMMGNEIATAIQYGANPIMIISDNAMYGTIGMHSYVRYPERPFMAGAPPPHPPFAPMAPPFPAPGAPIQNAGENAAPPPPTPLAPPT